jgi:dTDP-4-dehydrorhamnose 3,5-epimerase
MKIIKTKFKDLLIIKSKFYKDNRGSFKEVSKQKVLNKKFIFDCMSISKKNVLRGLHIQTTKSQAKFISVVKGEIFDVAVDLRKRSKTFGKYFSIKISEKSDFSLYIPEGFAHGFLCLSRENIVIYKCSNYQNQKSEKTLMWDDKKLKIKWPVKKNLILSKKDQRGLSFDQIILFT